MGRKRLLRVDFENISTPEYMEFEIAMNSEDIDKFVKFAPRVIQSWPYDIELETLSRQDIVTNMNYAQWIEVTRTIKNLAAQIMKGEDLDTGGIEIDLSRWNMGDRQKYVQESRRTNTETAEAFAKMLRMSVPVVVSWPYEYDIDEEGMEQLNFEQSMAVLHKIGNTIQEAFEGN